MSEARLKFSAVLFAVLWSAGMIVWNYYSGEMSRPVGVVLFAIGGALAGFLWYLAMRMFYRWSSRNS